MKKLLLAVFLFTGCATTGAIGGDECERINDPAAPEGFAVYSCPHGFFVPSYHNVDAHPGNTIQSSTVRYVEGVTNCVSKTIKFWDTYPEILAHEYRHARLCSQGGGNG
jgi:hypothetical protein